MKALVKPQSRQYFKRFEQPVEDLQTTMNNIQLKKIAKFVGIDPNEVKIFTWFFQIVSKLKLPAHNSRHLSEKKDQVIYLNELTHQEMHQHPSIALLKSLFYQTLANNKALYIFVEKESKLLPFVEQKMLRQCIGISSKRRDAEKVNLQRDENGRMAMSKLQRINPDFKSLLASRSYMLKMLVEKVFTRKEVLGKSKRANAYMTAISQYKQMMKQAQPQEDQQIESEQNFQLYQRIFQNSAYFYIKQYGNMENIPSRIISSKQYMQSTPQNVLKNIFLLNIDKQNIQLYWLARIMDCLPCPPNWSKKKGTSFDSYLFQPEKILFDIHPSYVYILHQINRFKGIFNKLSPIRQSYYINMRQLNFFDFFERKYTVDMFGYIQKSQKNNNKIKGKDRTKIKQEQLSDWMILQGVNNCTMTERQYVLIEHIQKLWSSLDFNLEPWSPSISPYGEVVWSSNVNNKSLTINPYKPKLSNLIKAQIKKLPQITDQILKNQYKSNKEQQIQQEDEDVIIINVDKLIKQRQYFLEYYLTHQDKAVPFPYEIKGHFMNMDQNNYFDQIFVSPFDLDKDVVAEGEPLPFWLQKTKAKQHTIDHTNLLIFNPQDFAQIKQKIAKYALQMVGEHEPHLIEQTEKKLNRIANADELIKFLSHINDLDLRQQRKKQYMQSLKFTEQDSDIFGSEISQMEIEDAVDDQQSVAQSIKPESRQVTEKSSVKHKSVQSQQQPDMIQMAEQIPVVEQKITPKEHEPYQFLKNFKKKYFRNINISQLSHEQLLRRIELAIKSKIKVTKYKRGLILKKVKKQLNMVRQILPFLKQQSQKDFNQIRWNLIITHLRHATIPYHSKKNVKRVKEKINNRNSQINYSQITDYNEFLSQISQYDVQQMEKYLQELRKNRLAQRKLKTLTERSNNQHQITNDTIQFQPIYQIKPSINDDPVLRHIKSVSTDLKDFRSTFNPRKKHISNQKDEQEGRNNFGVRKVISLKNLQQKIQNYNSTPASLSKNVSTKKIQKLDLNSRLSLVKREGMGTIPRLEQQKPFYRVCLDHTASHFLGKEAFLRKGDIITMQARKTLLSKGRGIETYISKFY